MGGCAAVMNASFTNADSNGQELTEFTEKQYGENPDYTTLYRRIVAEYLNPSRELWKIKKILKQVSISQYSIIVR